MAGRRGARAALQLVLVTAAAGRLHWLKRELSYDEDWASQGSSDGPDLPCDQPIAKAPVHFPEELLLGNAAEGLVMWSGYVNVTARDYLFYWLVEADEGAPPDAPVIFWSNGGPGCSSMEGATTEHGPLVLYDIKDDPNLGVPRFSRNPYAWNREAHIVYVDQPRYVGFSCGTGSFVTSSVDAGRDMVTFIRGWRLLFPEHAHRDVVLAAESYGGHFVPAWSDAILRYNAAGASDPIKLIGLCIGNGIINASIQEGTFTKFAREQGLLPSNVTVDSSWAAREVVRNYLGYQPNYYDYRLEELGCCGCSSYNYQSWSNFMMREEVARALNVCGNAGAKAFGGCGAGCIQMPVFDGYDQFSYSGALAQALDMGIKVTLFYGMQDTACNYVGGFMMATAIEWSGMQHFVQAPMEDLVIGGVVTGGIKSYGGLTWIQVDGAGHMVPINNPAAGSFAIGTVVRRPAGKPAAEHRGLGRVEALPGQLGLHHGPGVGSAAAAAAVTQQWLSPGPGRRRAAGGGHSRLPVDLAESVLLLALLGAMATCWVAARTRWRPGPGVHWQYASAAAGSQAPSDSSELSSVVSHSEEDLSEHLH